MAVFSKTLGCLLNDNYSCNILVLGFLPTNRRRPLRWSKSYRKHIQKHSVGSYYMQQDVDIIPTILSDKLSNILWEGDNQRPFYILDLVEKKEKLATC